MSLGQFYTEARRIEHPLYQIIPGTFFCVFREFFSTFRSAREHEREVIDMNEVRCRASGRVQRHPFSVRP
jgi:hypothetical protein